MTTRQLHFKKFVAGAVTTTMVASALVPVAAAASPFKDVPTTDSHYANILGAVDRGLMKGYSDGSFKPYQDISRGQVAKALANHVVNKENLSYKEYIAKYDLKNKVTPFKDVQASYNDTELFEASLIVKHANVFTGSNNNLMPSNKITRQQMAKVLVNAFNLKDLPGTDSNVKDNNKALAEFIPYINILSENGVTVVENFRPTETVKRAQIASFLIRAYDVAVEVPEDTLLPLNDNITVDRVNGHNVITIDYGSQMTASATNLANYQIDNRALTDAFYTGATAAFTNASNQVVKITLPVGKHEVEDEYKTITFSKNITAEDGRIVQTVDKKEFKAHKPFKDDTGPTLNKAEYVVASAAATSSQVLKLTFNENVKIDSQHISKDINVTVGTSTIAGTVTDGKYTDSANNDVLLVVLKERVNVSNTGTVAVVAEGATNPTMGITDIFANKATAKTVTLTNKVIDAGISDAVDADPKEDDKATIDLGLLDDVLLGGGISLDSLLNNEKLLRLQLPGSGLAIGDVLKLGSNDINLLTLSLTESDFNRGYVDLGLSTDILRTLTGGGGLLDLTAIAERDGNIIASTVESLNLPLFPVVKPVLDLLATHTVEDLMYILSGDKNLKVNLQAAGLDQIKEGDTLKLTLQGAKTETITHTITKADILNGYVNFRFTDKNLIQRLLTGLVSGDQVTFAVELTHDGQTAVGDPVTITVSEGLLKGILGLLDRLLGGGSLGTGLLDGLLDGLLGGGSGGGLLGGLFGGLFGK